MTNLYSVQYSYCSAGRLVRVGVEAVEAAEAAEAAGAAEGAETAEAAESGRIVN